VPIVELAVIETPGSAAVDDPGILDAAQDGIELGVADVESVVMALERVVLVEQQRQRVVHAHRGEMVVRSVEFQAEDLRKETSGGVLVTRRHDSVIERDRHGPPLSSYRANDIAEERFP